MSYRIDYHPKKCYDFAGRLPILTAICFLLFCVLVNLVWPQGVDALQEQLIQGEGAITAAALEELADSLQTGTRLSDALEVFLQQVLPDTEG